MSHGRTCPCGRGRGFRNERLARNVHDHMTSQPAEYYQCEHGQYHWRPKEAGA